MNKDCPHEKSVDFDRVIRELKVMFTQESSLKALFVSRELSRAKENWVCIDVAIAQQNACKNRSSIIFDSGQLIEHRRKHSSKVYVNIFSLEIVCFCCNTEILDETFTHSEGNRIRGFKEKLKTLILELDLASNSTAF